MMNITMKNEWKDHPIVVATISCAATATFIITTIVPTLEKQNLNKIKELEQNLSSAGEKSSQEIGKLELEVIQKDRTILDLKAAEKDLKVALEKIKSEERYSKNKPFPKGIRSIVVFSKYEDIKTAYPKSKFNPNTIYESIDIEDDTYSQAIYYPVTCSQTKLVHEVRYLFKTPADDFEKIVKNSPQNLGKTPYPTREEIDSSRSEKKLALIDTFNKLYDLKEKIDEDGSEQYLYIINDHLAALVTDYYLSIFSRYSHKQISDLKDCEKLLEFTSSHILDQDETQREHTKK